MKKIIFTVTLAIFFSAISLAHTTTETLQKGVMVEEIAYSGHSNLGGNVFELNMPLSTGTSGTTGKVYVVENQDDSGKCITLATNVEYPIGSIVETVVIGGAVSAYGVLNTCVIRMSHSLSSVILNDGSLGTSIDAGESNIDIE